MSKPLPLVPEEKQFHKGFEGLQGEKWSLREVFLELILSIELVLQQVAKVDTLDAGEDFLSCK